MTREIDSAVATAARAEVVRPVALVSMAFDTGTTRATSAPYDITIDADGDGTAETFLGVGNLGRVGAVQETSELRATNVELELSGIPSELLSLALAEHYQGRTARLWVLLVDEDHAPVGPACLVMRGRMDTMVIERGETATIRLNVESQLVDLERPRALRWTDADQQNLFTGDRGFSFVSQAVEKKLAWGKGDARFVAGAG